ncbi:energy-coupling factor transporter transmembrane component T [Pseudoramibacter porci]|uniref:Energy-coupling factor transporter transmembrane protein EcfT n=1 Tax=Pseudoramibacter porci TaxID=2606631 RepID=A0A7X2NH98_9FIRM|nr:energy-coupling factor transporter transmembrane component T [Pseudoramibacter porci]MSS20375.1 energy-coupling factor transporter transmembrane protein EcfT [Pseudoramibacter porci]
MRLNLKVMEMTGRLLRSDRENASRKPSPVAPALRVGAAVLCILLCALSQNAVYVITVIAVELLRLAMMPPASILRVIKALILPVIFSALIMLPAVFLGHPRTMLTVTMKVLESVMVLAVMNEGLDWREVTAAFSAFKGMAVFVLILDMTMRFLMILGDYSGKLLEAVMLRSVGKTSWKNAKVDGILGTTFLKSRQMAEATEEAMACRCFNGQYRSYHQHGLTWRDGLFLGVYAAMIAFFILTK